MSKVGTAEWNAEVLARHERVMEQFTALGLNRKDSQQLLSDLCKYAVETIEAKGHLIKTVDPTKEYIELVELCRQKDEQIAALAEEKNTLEKSVSDLEGRNRKLQVCLGRIMGIVDDCR